MSFVEVSEQEWVSRLIGAMDFKQEFLEKFKFSTKTTLGRGSFSKVFSARSTRDGKRTTFAVKLMESKVAIEDGLRSRTSGTPCALTRTFSGFTRSTTARWRPAQKTRWSANWQIGISGPSSCTTLALTWGTPVFGRWTCAPASGTCIHVI